MATTGRKKRTTKASGKKRATTRGKQAPSPPTPDVAEAESSVRQALATTQMQIDQSLQEIRREMASFQEQVMAAVETVHSEQARGLTRVRQAMEAALHRPERSGTPTRPSGDRSDEDPGDEEPADAVLAAMRATGDGVESVRHAVGNISDAVDEMTMEPLGAYDEGVVSVEKAVHGTAEPGADATHEGVESVRAAVGASAADAGRSA